SEKAQQGTPGADGGRRASSKGDGFPPGGFASQPGHDADANCFRGRVTSVPKHALELQGSAVQALSNAPFLASIAHPLEATLSWGRGQKPGAGRKSSPSLLACEPPDEAWSDVLLNQGSLQDVGIGEDLQDLRSPRKSISFDGPPEEEWKERVRTVL